MAFLIQCLKGFNNWIFEISCCVWYGHFLQWCVSGLIVSGSRSKKSPNWFQSYFEIKRLLLYKSEPKPLRLATFFFGSDFENIISCEKKRRLNSALSFIFNFWIRIHGPKWIRIRPDVLLIILHLIYVSLFFS